MKLKVINYKRKLQNSQIYWDLNNTHLHNVKMSKKKKSKGIKKTEKWNKYSLPQLRDAAKAALKEKCVAINVYIQWWSQINDLTLKLKDLKIKNKLTQI